MTHDSPEAQAHIRSYWRKNLILLAWLLSVWFIVSFGCGVLFVDALDRFRIPGTGFKLGFWFAQQGSIYTFIILIAIYVVVMNRLDRSVHKEVEEEIAEANASASEI